VNLVSDGAASPRRRSPFNAPLLLGNLAVFALAWFLWDTRAMLPLKLLVVFFHESGHALAAWLTGGEVVSIQIDPRQAGVTLTRGGSRFVILSMGYLGSTAIGLAIFYLSHRRNVGKYLMEGMGVAILALLIGWVRDPFTITFCALTAGAFLFIGMKDWLVLEIAIARFVGIASSLYALIDIRNDLLHWTRPDMHFVGGAGKSDAEAIAEIIPLPPIVWGVLWALLSAGALLWVLARIAALPQEHLLTLDEPATARNSPSA
jgi:hypothetical protein